MLLLSKYLNKKQVFLIRQKDTLPHRKSMMYQVKYSFFVYNKILFIISLSLVVR